MMKYPIGIQSFEQIIKDGYVYVDKTALIYDLVTRGKIYFLSPTFWVGRSCSRVWPSVRWRRSGWSIRCFTLISMPGISRKRVL